ncbi:sodium:proton antiporter [Rhodococcus sp. Leaf7]|uniref:DUF6328 family protein n=1 Tax=unclassified Rhodococcus (in: high G+C Gram-positive bacteria) TaxID=192944 RepID=UPI0006F1FD2B|nr:MULTISPECIES: DUF6328 family protein [unclassified Rhodococcus (in: high G+C Gram-positive bacteria)]KQU07321.1 sodium:proton antiporter [Rhodococcus sp. Leaf7]KQU42839.1 sodium:proton antiporter [Rhodococcus sp. Leaf247]
MTADDSLRDSDWNARERNETDTQRLDRNWSNLLQELRVVQTGIQLLTGFLLTLPFQARFPELRTYEQVIYLVTLGASVTATILLVAPVALHRILFRRRALRQLVDYANRFAIIGFVLLGIAMSGVPIIIFGLVVGPVAGVVAGAVSACLFATVCVALPLRVRRTLGPQQ